MNKSHSRHSSIRPGDRKTVVDLAGPQQLPYAQSVSAEATKIAGGTGTNFKILSAAETATTLTFLGNTALEADVSAATLSVGENPEKSPYAVTDAVTIQQAATLTASGKLSLHSNLEADGTGAVLHLANGTEGGSTGHSELLVLNDATASAAAYTLADGDIGIDALGSFEIGATGGAAKGVLTIDGNATFSVTGLAAIDNAVTDSGLLAIGASDSLGIAGNLALAGEVTVGTSGTLGVTGNVAGAGQIVIGNSGSLGITGAATGLKEISLGNSSILSLSGTAAGIGGIQAGTGCTLVFGPTVSAAGPIILGAKSTASFGNLDGNGVLQLGADASADIAGTLSNNSSVTLATGASISFVQQPSSAGAEDANVPIILAGSNGIGLNPGAEILGAVEDFNDTDGIVVYGFNPPIGGTAVTTATFAAGSGGAGTLTLADDGTRLDTIVLSGSYAGQQFLTNVAGYLDAGSSTVVLASGTMNGLGGSGNVTVTGESGVNFNILAGSGSASELTFNGNTAVEGSFSAGTLVANGTLTATFNATDIEAGGTLTATTEAAIASAVELDGKGALLRVTGPLALGGSGTQQAQLILLDGARAEVTDLQLTGGAAGDLQSGAVLYLDSTSSMEIGTAGTATAAGTLTIDAGAYLEDNGPGVLANAPAIVDNGLIAVTAPALQSFSGGELTGAVSGTGTIEIDAGYSLLIAGNVTGLSSIQEGESSAFTITGNLASSLSLTTGVASSTTIGGTVSGLAGLTVGRLGALSIGGAMVNVQGLTLQQGTLVSSGGVQTAELTVASIIGTVSSTGSGGITLDSYAELQLGGKDTNVPITLSGNDVLDIGEAVSIGGDLHGFNTTDLLTLDTLAFTLGGRPITAATVTGSGTGQTLVLSDDGSTVTTIALAGSYAGQTFLTNVAGLGGQTTAVTLPSSTLTSLGSGGTITGATGYLMQLITGGGSVGTLTFTGNNALAANVTASNVTIAGPSANAINAFDIEAGATLAATAGATIQSHAELDGAGAALTDAGLLTIGGGPSGAELYVLNSSNVSAHGLALAASTGAAINDAQIFLDKTASVTIGTGATAAAGTLLINSGATLTANGLNVMVTAPALVDDGTILIAASGSVSDTTIAATVSGTGSVSLAGTTSLVFAGAVSGLGAITTGTSSDLTFAGTVTDAGPIVTGADSGTEFAGSVSGIASITEGASAGMTFVGSVSGTGTLSIGADATCSIFGTVSGLKGITIGSGATLVLTGEDANVPITMSASSTLVIDPATPIDATITDFARGDVIETLLANQGTIVTAAAYTAGSHGNGTLVLSDDGHALNTLTLQGSYAGDQFLTNAAGAGGVTDITIAPTPSSSQLR